MGVRIGYVAGDFQCLLDSDVYLPESWVNDPARSRKAGVPDEVVSRKKTDIALDQVSRSLQNGIRVSAWTLDAWYGCAYPTQPDTAGVPVGGYSTGIP